MRRNTSNYFPNLGRREFQSRKSPLLEVCPCKYFFVGGWGKHYFHYIQYFHCILFLFGLKEILMIIVVNINMKEILVITFVGILKRKLFM